MSSSGATALPVPALRAGVDITKMSLSMEEGFVASRVDGMCTVADIATLVGKDISETTKILTKLAKTGVIQFGEIKADTRTRPDADNDYAGFIFPVALMQETCDVDEATRKRIIFTHDRLEVWTHYELLQISRRADEREVKKAYFARSKEWHPDRFRRGEQGSFKRLIETIYKRINDAYRELTDEEERRVYDDGIVFELDPDEIERLVEVQKEQKRAERHEERLAERRKKKNPVRQRIQKAKDFYDKAVKLESEGRVVEALRSAQMAVTYDDKRKEYRVLAESLKDRAAEHRIERYLKRGTHFEHMTEWDDAIDMFEEAVRIAPNSGRGRLRLAYNLLAAGRDVQVALGHAQRAVALLPEEAEAHYVVGRLYEKSGMDKVAKRAYQQALQLRPGYAEVKKRLTRLKWGF